MVKNKQGELKKNSYGWVQFIKERRDRFYFKPLFFANKFARDTYYLFDKRRKKILITGCGWSGTGYVSRLLTEMGFPIGHECMLRYGAAAWPLAVSSEKVIRYMNFCRQDYQFETILHQVRNPLHVIGSAHSAPDPAWEYIRHFIPINGGDSITKKCMKYWYYWNLLAEKSASYTYQIEELESNFDKFCLAIKRPDLTKKVLVFKKINKRVNSHENEDGYRHQVSWDDLASEDQELCLKIRGLAQRYGY